MNLAKRRETVAKAMAFVGDLFSQPQGYAIAKACGFTHSPAEFWAFHADFHAGISAGRFHYPTDRADVVLAVLKVAARAYQEFLSDPPKDGTREEILELSDSLNAVNQLLREQSMA